MPVDRRRWQPCLFGTLSESRHLGIHVSHARAHTRAHDYARYERRASRLWSPSSFSVSRAPASAGQRLNDPPLARLPDIIGQTSPPGP